MAAQLECYVYVVLPGSKEFVTAGRFLQNRDRQGQPVGTFVYGRRYRERPDAVEVDPVQLKLRQGPFVSLPRQGVHPWTSAAISGERRLGDHGLAPPEPKPLLWLAFLGRPLGDSKGATRVGLHPSGYGALRRGEGHAWDLCKLEPAAIANGRPA
jgi:hypothetical protein